MAASASSTSELVVESLKTVSPPLPAANASQLSTSQKTLVSQPDQFKDSHNTSRDAQSNSQAQSSQMAAVNTREGRAELSPRVSSENAVSKDAKQSKKNKVITSKQEKTKKAKKMSATNKKLSSSAANKATQDHDGANDNQHNHNQQTSSSSSIAAANAKPRSLVEELKLFQNNHLLNQQDPLHQLHIQLNKLIKDGDNVRASSRPSPFSGGQSATQQHHQSNGIDNRLSQMQRQQQQISIQDSTAVYDNSDENIFTVKKGVLWQQQNYDKFHQRLFSRWKKRYFILTTDYLVCFKRSAPKVGRSEMGKFLYKTSLSDVTKIEWLKPKKSDKGAIVVHINGQFNLFLWSKGNLEEWMLMISESIERNKIRRSYIMQNGTRRFAINNLIKIPSLNHHQAHDGDLYENTNLAVCADALQAVEPDNGITSHKPQPEYTTEDKNNMISSSNDQANRSHGITKRHSTTNSAHPSLDASTNTRSEQKSADTYREEEKNNLKSNVDSPRSQHGNDDARIKSSPHSSVLSSESEKVNLIEREYRKDNFDLGDGQNEHAESEGKKVDSVQPSGRGRKPIMINDASNNESYSTSNSAKLSNQLEESSSPLSAVISKSGSGSRCGSGSSRAGPESFRHRSERIQASNDLSSGPDRPSDNDTVKNSKADSLASPAGDIKDKESNLIRPNKGSGRKRSNARTAAGNSAEDELCNNSCNIDRNKSDNINKCTSSVACDSEKSSKKSAQTKTAINLEKTIQRSSTNLIRRDDSWQSLVSLTRIGKVTPAIMKVAQRSLYAQHIMPDNNDRDKQAHSRPHIINIESTITPCRGPLLRQQSIQPSSQRKLRPLHPIGQHAASFDVAPNSPLQANQKGISYQQKLLQLQLLHNSNNVDYIRHNGDTTHGDYQIYGPESTANHYGYSSMRSNLKSATSEFSFIRPSTSSHNQSTLPHQNPSFVLLANQGTNHQPIRSSLILPNKISANHIHQSDNNNNDIGCLSPMSKQFLVNPMTGERIINQQSLNNTKDMMIPELLPPMRELPLKPNKKRALNDTSNINDGTILPKSSSLTSSIACFFRRAFSRRSKKGSKRRSKLAESCSSSLGAFEDGFTNILIAPSAFSTGSKSVDGRKNHIQQQVMQPQRMVDMIEAFNNKTHSADTGNGIPQLDPAQEESRQYSALNMDFSATPKAANHLKATLNQFGSPLHKSNSICATMGLSLADANNRRAFLYDNEMMAVDGRSPMLMRSTKVMSANLTPLMSQKEQADGTHNQFFISPRNSRPDHLPRPSSIYGQPSMISSPVITREDRNFGVHRNSLHNHHLRDRNHNSEFEIRRHQMMKMPFLDTTREVVEEIASPTTESINPDYEQACNSRHSQSIEQQSPHGRYLIKRENFNMISASPSSGKLQHRQAVVNPILQSPTMDTIYDNHPVLSGPELSSYSHYDNHNHLLNDHHHKQQQQQYHQSPSQCQSKVSTSMTQFQTTGMPPSPAVHEKQYSNKMNICNIMNQSHTPSRQRLSEMERATVMDMMNVHQKPSAVVAPSTPNNSSNNFRNDSSSLNSPIMNQSGNLNHTQFSLQPQARSPMLSRRIANQPHYQQSPLVSLQTRVVNKGDGVQATIIRDCGDGGFRVGQPVINIAGAPGINLEPSLAASLLRGTNINAYESSTFDRFAPDQPKFNPKTFLVSTRLSKSMAYSQSSSNENGSTSSMLRDESTATAASNSTTRSPKDELTSSGSRSMNSSIGRGSMQARVSNSSQEDQQEESSGSDTRGGKGTKANKCSQLNRKASSRSSKRDRRESSSEPSEEITSHVGSDLLAMLDEPDERNWITSKLVD